MPHSLWQARRLRCVAILVTDGSEQDELEKPRRALDEAGANTRIVSPAKGKARGWKSTEWGDEVPVDLALKEASPDEFDALLLPGGVMSPDKLRMMPEAVEFVKTFFDAGKPIAAICASWTDEEAVTDGNLTSRNPDDIPAFNRAMIELFSGAYQQQRERAAYANCKKSLQPAFLNNARQSLVKSEQCL